MRGGRLLALAIALATLCPAGGAWAGTTASPPYCCLKLQPGESITIDGSLTEQAWTQATLISDFQCADGVTKPRFGTEFRARWDDQYLYLAFKCADPDIIAGKTERDSFVYEDDCVEAFISSGDDRGHYYEFEINARNTVMDAEVQFDEDWKDKVVDYSWNCVGMKSAAKARGAIETHDDRDVGWVVEMALPFSLIGRDGQVPESREKWHANLYRVENTGHAEFICWRPTMTDPPSFHEPAAFGEFCFCRSLAERRSAAR